jgi:hypothetical protein
MTLAIRTLHPAHKSAITAHNVVIGTARMVGPGGAKLTSSRPLQVASADVISDSCGMDKIVPIGIAVVLLSAATVALIIWITL